MVWQKLGKKGLAVNSPWPIAQEEDKILTRQAKFVRDSARNFRTQAGKAKKGLDKASIVVTDSYPQWKVETLQWMQEQFDEKSGFRDTFMKDLKDWTSESISDKKLIKITMQFASFMKNEVGEVGSMAMELQLPFDQKEILELNLDYIKSQLNLSSLDIIKADDEGNEIPERVSENVTPGKPYLWLR